MDYIFRWLQLRFLTGQQQALFDGLRPKYVNAPPPGTPDENGYGQKSFGDFNEGVEPRRGELSSRAEAPTSVCHPDRRGRVDRAAEGSAVPVEGSLAPSTPPTR